MGSTQSAHINVMYNSLDLGLSTLKWHVVKTTSCIISLTRAATSGRLGPQPAGSARNRKVGWRVGTALTLTAMHPFQR